MTMNNHHACPSEHAIKNYNQFLDATEKWLNTLVTEFNLQYIKIWMKFSMWLANSGMPNFRYTIGPYMTLKPMHNWLTVKCI